MLNDIVPSKNHRLTILDKKSGLNFLVDTGELVSVIPGSRKQILSGAYANYKLNAANNIEFKTYGTKTFNINEIDEITSSLLVFYYCRCISSLSANFSKYHNL